MRSGPMMSKYQSLLFQSVPLLGTLTTSNQRLMREERERQQREEAARRHRLPSARVLQERLKSNATLRRLSRALVAVPTDRPGLRGRKVYGEHRFIRLHYWRIRARVVASCGPISGPFTSYRDVIFCQDGGDASNEVSFTCQGGWQCFSNIQDFSIN